MDEIQQRRNQFDYLHRDKGGFEKLCHLLDDYTFSYSEIAQYFGFFSGRSYIAQLLQRLGLDSKRNYLTLQGIRDNFNKIYKTQEGVTKLVEMLEAQASDKDIAEQFSIAEERVERVLRRLGFHRRNFRIKYQLSPRERFDQKYQNQGGIDQFIRMAKNPQVSLQDIAEHFGYKSGSGVWRAIKRLGMDYDVVAEATHIHVEYDPDEIKED